MRAAGGGVARQDCSTRQSCALRKTKIAVFFAARSSLAPSFGAADGDRVRKILAEDSAVTAHKKSASRSHEITVQPREHTREASIDHYDVCASLAPEELGENALRAATQSGWPPEDSDAHSLGEVAASAAPVFDEYNDQSGDDLWAETLDLALEYGAWVEFGRDGGAGFEWDDPFEATWSRDVELNQPKIVEASLFDAGSEETVYETRAPRVHT